MAQDSKNIKQDFQVVIRSDDYDHEIWIREESMEFALSHLHSFRKNDIRNATSIIIGTIDPVVSKGVFKGEPVKQKIAIAPNDQHEVKWLFNHSVFTSWLKAQSHVEHDLRKCCYWDMHSLKKRCKIYTNKEKDGHTKIDVELVYQAYIGLAVCHVLSSNGRFDLDEDEDQEFPKAIKCLEKAHNVMPNDKEMRAQSLNVYLRVRNLLSEHRKTRTGKAFRKAKSSLSKMKKSNPELTEAIDKHIQHLVEFHGGMAVRLYRLEGKIKEGMTLARNLIWASTDRQA